MSMIQPSIKLSCIDYKQLCKEYQDIVPVKILEKTFNIKITSYKEQHKYSKLFNKNCEQNIKNFFRFEQLEALIKNIKDEDDYIETFKNFFYTNLVTEKYYDNIEDPDRELFINLVIFLTEVLVPWSIFFCLTPSGIRLVKKIFKNNKEAIITLSIWLTQLWLLEQYDTLFFRKEFFTFLPSILPMEGIKKYLREAIVRLGLFGVKKYILSYYNMFEPSVKEQELEIVEINEQKDEDRARKSIRKYKERTSQRKKKRQSRRKNIF
jgi:hypothetical protein